MPTRTLSTSVTFRKPFRLSAVDGLQPAGTYRIETDEHQIDGLSFNAFQHQSTTLFLPADPKPGVTRQSVQIDRAELADALARDASGPQDDTATERPANPTPDDATD
jgi:hypothetical protein